MVETRASLGCSKYVFLLAATLWGASLAAAPFVPARDTQIVERLPVTGNAEVRDLRKRRHDLARQPDNLSLANELARRYIRMGRTQGDPRFFGYAQSTLEPWWNDPQPPSEVLVLRATLRQNRHDFEGALKDLTRVLRREPRNAQAWLTRAVVLQVRGDPRGALESCLGLARSNAGLMSVACASGAASHIGQAEKSYETLRRALERDSSATIEERVWTLGTLAEIAARLGRAGVAQRHFERALELGGRDVYLLSAYADLLLDQGRPGAVRDLLERETRVDALLLRLALAERQLDSPKLGQLVVELRTRFAASRVRGERTHLGAEARFTLHLLNEPRAALELARENWSNQREPRDARRVLEAAIASADPEAAQPVLDWLQETRLEDARLHALARRLEQPLARQFEEMAL